MSFYKAYAVALGSLLTGAAVVHQIYKPDLVCRAVVAPQRPVTSLRSCHSTILPTKVPVTSHMVPITGQAVVHHCQYSLSDLSKQGMLACTEDPLGPACPQ